MSSDGLGARVTRLENDTESIYEILGEVQNKLVDHDARFDAIDQRLDGIDQRFDGVDSTLAEVLRRLPEA
ncbi:MAG TPA: hypothetical protein VF426_01615 [Marmoricola sp.]